MSELTLSKKAKLQEVAELMHKIYLTLARMRYLDPLWINPGPHPISPSLLQTYHSHNLDPSIIYLYSILPYVDTAGAEYVDFFKGSYFADFRDPEQVKRGRDPFYDDVDLRPWMTALSMLGNHQSVILFDAKEVRVGIYDQESGGSTDRGLEEWMLNGGDQDESDEGEDEEMDGNEEGEENREEQDDSEEEEEEEGSEASERPYDEMDSRRASEVLRDISKWYNELIYTPGGGENSPLAWEKDVIEPLYRKHGWPGEDFDGDAFLVDKARILAAASAKYECEEPVQRVECLEGWMERDKIEPLQEKLKAARTDDEKWFIRWELWRTEERNNRNTKELKVIKEQMNIACPNGQCQKPEELPLWEVRRLRQELGWKESTLKKELDMAAEMETGKQEKRPKFALCVRYAEQQVEIWQKAVKASELDAERLCPGKSLPIKPGEVDLGMELRTNNKIEELASGAEGLQQNIKIIREWILQLPENAVEARKAAQNEIDRNERSIEGSEKQIASLRKYVEDLSGRS